MKSVLLLITHSVLGAPSLWRVGDYQAFGVFSEVPETQHSFRNLFSCDHRALRKVKSSFISPLVFLANQADWTPGLHPEYTAGGFYFENETAPSNSECSMLHRTPGGLLILGLLNPISIV